MTENKIHLSVPTTRKAAEEFIRSIATSFTITMKSKNNIFRARLIFKAHDEDSSDTASINERWTIGDTAGGDAAIIKLASEAHAILFNYENNALPLLAEFGWLRIIIEKRYKSDQRDPALRELAKFSKELDARLNQYRYDRDSARTKLESMCLNGCRRSRKDGSEYCSVRCQNTFWKWVKAQSVAKAYNVRLNVKRKSERFCRKFR